MAREGRDGTHLIPKRRDVRMLARAWAGRWTKEPTIVRCRSDSMAAIGAVERGGSSKSPATNMILKELALVIALSPTGLRIQVSHIRGDNNAWADALSRIHQPGSGARVPGPLRALPPTQVPARGPGWWVLEGLKERVTTALAEGGAV